MVLEDAAIWLKPSSREKINIHEDVSVLMICSFFDVLINVYIELGNNEVFHSAVTCRNPITAEA